MAKRNYGITKQHGQSLDEILAWARKHPETTPLEIGVLEEMCERVKRHARDGAIVRVRLANHPKPVYLRRSQPKPEKAPAKPRKERGPHVEWTVAELTLLEQMCREKKLMVDIEERLPGRTHQAIKMQLSRMHLHAGRVYGNCFSRTTHDDRGVLARARALRAEKLERMIAS